MSDQANRLDRIKALREQDYGVAALSPDDVDWLIAQLAEAQARLAESDAYWRERAELAEASVALWRERAEGGDWRIAASAWLTHKADKQASINKKNPAYVACYPEWEKAERDLRWYANEVLSTSFSAPVSLAAQATDARMAAVEQAAALAEKVSGPDTARTIRHNGVVMRGDCECTMCKRYNHVEG